MLGSSNPEGGNGERGLPGKGTAKGGWGAWSVLATQRGPGTCDGDRRLGSHTQRKKSFERGLNEKNERQQWGGETSKRSLTVKKGTEGITPKVACAGQ